MRMSAEASAPPERSRSILSRWDHRFIDWLAPRVPAWISSRQLTLLTAVWSGLVWFGCYLASANRQWLWLSTAAIAAQYLTDALDGKIGKLRNDGFVRWGHYMDHLLDYVFMAAIFSG